MTCTYWIFKGLASLVAQSVKKPPAVQESTFNAGDLDSICGSGRYPGEGNGNLLQYSCLKSPMNRGTCLAIVHGVARVRHNLVTTPPTQRCH